MVPDKYDILIDGKVAASEMDLDLAICFVRGYFEQYFNDAGPISIQRHPYTKEKAKVIKDNPDYPG